MQSRPSWAKKNRHCGDGGDGGGGSAVGGGVQRSAGAAVVADVPEGCWPKKRMRC